MKRVANREAERVPQIGHLSHGTEADHLSAAAYEAAQKRDLKELGRIETELFQLVATAASTDVTLARPAEAVLRGWSNCGQFARAIAFSREITKALGFERIASSEVHLMMTMGDLAGARALSEELVAAPIYFGGHGLRAFYLELLGRRAEAAIDGAIFVDESRAVHRSPEVAREVARRYTPANVKLMEQLGATYAELESSSPNSRPWRGEPLDGRAVVLRLTEGLGDQLQGLRLASTIRQAGGRVLVSCSPLLKELVQQSHLADQDTGAPIQPRGPPGRVLRRRQWTSSRDRSRSISMGTGTVPGRGPR